MHEPGEEQGEHEGRHALGELGNRCVGLQEGEEEGVDEVEGVGEDADLADPGPVEEAEGQPIGMADYGDEDGDEGEALHRVAPGLAEGDIAQDEAAEQHDEAEGQQDEEQEATRQAAGIERGILPHGKGAAEEQAVEAGVRAVAGARMMAAAVVEVDHLPVMHEQHPPHEHQRGEAHEHDELMPAIRQQLSQPEVEQREEQIEVLLHRERPHDLRACGLKAAVNLPHIRDEARLRRHGRPTEAALHPALRRQQRDDSQHQIERWKDAQGASQVEVAQVHPAGAFTLHPHQRGDEVAAEEEEHRHPKQPRHDMREPRVTQEHDPDRDRSQAVEGRDLEETGRGGDHETGRREM